jgi:hypothetical protein
MSASPHPHVATPAPGTIWKLGYELVLLALVLVIVITAAASGATLPPGRFLSMVLLSSALLLALRLAQAPVRTQRIAGVLVGITLVGALAMLFDDRIPTGFHNLLSLVLVGATPVVLARRLVQNSDVSGQSVLGALCVYLLIGLFFALVFALTADLTGAPFFRSDTDAGPADYLYFSFITLTTVGYGDLVAGATLGHMLSATEGVVGQIYLVTVVALLVSSFRDRTRNRE